MKIPNEHPMGWRLFYLVHIWSMDQKWSRSEPEVDLNFTTQMFFFFTSKDFGTELTTGSEDRNPGFMDRLHSSFSSIIMILIGFQSGFFRFDFWSISGPWTRSGPDPDQI